MKLRVCRDGDAYRLTGEALAMIADANRFLESLHIRGLSPHTIRAYAFDLVSLLAWLHELGAKVAELEQATLLSYVVTQRESGAQPRTINRRLTTCSLLFRFVTGRDIPRGVGASSPGPHYRGRGRERALGLHQMHGQRHLQLRVKVAQKVVEPLTITQVRAFFRTIRRYRDLAVVHLMLFCGLRSREVLALTLSDLEFNEGRLRIMGKGQRERVLPMPNAFRAVVNDYLRLERPIEATTERLFVVLQGQRRGQPMTPAGLRSLFRQRRKTRPGLRNANAHRWRHTFGADMARAGVRFALLQRMMGHADGKTTLQYINLSMTDIAAEFARAHKIIEKQYEQF